MDRAIVIRDFGGPDVLLQEPIEVPDPSPGEILVSQTAIGVNFHDTYVRTGLYKTLTLPGIPGLEAVGRVAAVGAGVEGFAVGDRIGYVDKRYGAYASRRVLAAGLAVRLPNGLDDATWAGFLLKGLTVAMLAKGIEVLRAGRTVLVHAAAGGVGRLLCQWASHLGCRVMGTVGTPEKMRVARAAGCAEVIDYRRSDFAAEALALTHGRGVDVVYDAVGRDTIEGSFECLAPRGHLVNYGQASGPIAPIDIGRLAGKSLRLSRPVLFHFIDSAEDLQRLSRRMLSAVTEGWLVPSSPSTFPLDRAGDAHRALEGRGLAGSPVLLT